MSGANLDAVREPIRDFRDAMKLQLRRVLGSFALANKVLDDIEVTLEVERLALRCQAANQPAVEVDKRTTTRPTVPKRRSDDDDGVKTPVVQTRANPRAKRSRPP